MNCHDVLQVNSKEMIQRGQEIVKKLKDPCEMCYTSLARIAAASAYQPHHVSSSFADLNTSAMLSIPTTHRAF